MKYLLLLFILLPIVTFSQTKWNPIFKTNKGDEYFLNEKLVSRGKVDFKTDVIKIWVRVKLPLFTVGNETYKNIEERILYAIDCKDKQVAISSIILYNSTMSKVLKSDHVKDYNLDWKIPVPESVGERILNVILELFSEKN